MKSTDHATNFALHKSAVSQTAPNQRNQSGANDLLTQVFASPRQRLEAVVVGIHFNSASFAAFSGLRNDRQFVSPFMEMPSNEEVPMRRPFRLIPPQTLGHRERVIASRLF
jgi:hypothetical protein